MLRFVPVLAGIKLLAAQQISDTVIVDKFNRRRKSYRNPKYPVVLCHGLSGFDRLFVVPPLVKLTPTSDERDELQRALARNAGGIYVDYWYGIQDALESNGCTVIVAKVPPFGSIEDRAQALNTFIETKIRDLKLDTGNDPHDIYNDGNRAGEPQAHKIKVNLVAHSMGGLDSRYLISQIEQKNYDVMSLTTISTPHHGSSMADYVLHAARAIRSFVPKSIDELTTDSLCEFNRTVKDDPSVKYFSYGSKFDPNYTNVFYFSWKLIYEQEGENDGLVSVKSSKWGKYLGTLDGVDHLDTINWSNSVRRLWSQYVTKTPVNFDAVALYLDIIDQLAQEGF